MNRRITLALYLVCLLLVVVSCSQTKYVNEGDYLITKNKVHFINIDVTEADTNWINSHADIETSEMTALIKPQSNNKFKLFLYNRIDTTKHIAQMAEKELKYIEKNERRGAKERDINLKRIAKGEERGDSLYRHKVIPPKEIHYGWRDKYLDIFGQAPILLDTSRLAKSQKQLELYLLKKGFYNAHVADSVFIEDKKAEVHFYVNPQKPYRIRNVTIDTTSFETNILKGYNALVRKEGEIIQEGALLDQDVLDDGRDRLAFYCRNDIALFGFSKKHIQFLVDTTIGYLQADVMYFVKPKLIADTLTDGFKKIKYESHKIRGVKFNIHNFNEASFKDFEQYKKRCDSFALAGLFLPDTLDFDYKIDGEYPLLDTINLEAEGKGIFLYNERPQISPKLLDRQNFLEMDMYHAGGKRRFYKERYVEMSYRTLYSLGVFSNIAVHVKIDPEAINDRWLLVEYDLTMANAQSFLAEPRITNTNGVFGIEGQLSYTHKNIFKKAKRFEFSILGGVESQPLIVGEQDEQHRIWKLNTFEIGPKVSFTVPKLTVFDWLLGKTLSKRAYPKTVIEVGGNYQKRLEFSRLSGLADFNVNLKIPKTIGLDLTGLRINYVRLNKSDEFQTQLDNLNNPFLLNAYNDHLAIMSGGIIHYNNLNSKRRTKRHQHDVQIEGFVSGKLLTHVIYNRLIAKNSWIADVNDEGFRTLFNNAYTEFVKITAQYIANQYINPKHNIAYRAIVGLGFAEDNSLALPYEYAYFAGGSNDIRAFPARTMAPGSYKTYAEENATITQIGDIKLEGNVEWRFNMTDLLEGALFIDAGNIWNRHRNTIPIDDPTVLKLSSWREVAIGFGYGVRADFDFLIVRIDLAIALHNPHLPSSERWLWETKDTYRSTTYFNYDSDLSEFTNYLSPHPILINFGIGYPF